MTATMLLEWIASRWKSYRLRKRMRASAGLLVKTRAVKPEVLRYLEKLEFKVDEQERELRMLRWTLEGELMADWDRDQDVREARGKRDDPLRRE